MARIAVFGGSFDPPHNGHALCLSALLNSGLIDQVLVVPVGNDRRDKPTIAQASDRQTMVELMISESFAPYGQKVQIETIQLEGKLSGSYTIDLLRYLESKRPQDELNFVIGLDNLSQIQDWKEGPKLLAEYRFLAIPRLGEAKPQGFAGHLHIIEQAGLISTNISSSFLRELFANGKCVAGMLTTSVERFIREKRLYILKK